MADNKNKEKKKNTFWSDFKAFITRGNILDMAVGVIVGGAFTAIITALSNNILKPIINWILAGILGKDSLSEVYTFLSRVNAPDGTPDLTQSIYIDWGAFINAIINFLLIALVLFTILRVITKLHTRMEHVIHEEKNAAAKREAEAKAAEEKAKAEAEAKAAAEKAEAEAKAAQEKAETEKQFYLNVQKQTELLEKIAAGMKQ